MKPRNFIIFRLGEDIDFAVSILRSAGSELSTLAALLASPYFGIGLITYGVAHVIFVGEPKRALRSNAWVYIGWAIFAVCLSAMVITATWGAIQAYIAHEVSARITDRYWYLSNDQRRNLGKELDAVPSGRRFPISLEIVFGNAQASTMAEDLATIFHEHGWVMSGGIDARLRADLEGIEFITNLDFPRTDKDMPIHAAELWWILHRAGINTGAAWQRGFDNNSLVLAIGGRPPNW